MKKFYACVLISVLVRSLPAQSPVIIKIERGEGWWGGAIAQAHLSPYGRVPFISTLTYDTKGNQAQPVLLSSLGRVIWSENPLTLYFNLINTLWYCIDTVDIT